MYFVSKALLAAETRYPAVEKAVLALVIAARKLRPYFHAHSIEVLSDLPLHSLLHRPTLSGRLTKWVIELSEFDIEYRPRPAIKAQALADFITETSFREEEGGGSKGSEWTLHVDGAANAEGCGAGIVLTSPAGEVYEHSISLDFHVTNNEAEYEALIAGLELALANNVETLNCFSDSEVVVNQIHGTYEAKTGNLPSYHSKAMTLISMFRLFLITAIPRTENVRADELAKMASGGIPRQEAIRKRRREQGLVCFHTQKVMTNQLEQPEELSPDDWRFPIVEYLTKGVGPTDPKARRRLQVQAARFYMSRGMLFKRGYGPQELKCMSTEESKQLLVEIHAGLCGTHAGWRSLVQKAIRQGRYWLTMKADAQKVAQTCQACQFYAPASHQPGTEMQIMTGPCPFAMWGLDLLGPFSPKAPGQLEFIIVAVDYFTKWIEAIPLASTTVANVKKFLWQNIICRYGLPQEIITDRGPQFNSPKLAEWCESLGIRLKIASVAHPHCNGQVEAANKSIVNGLKKRLDGARGRWAEVLPLVLWANRTTAKKATGETPFALAYGVEAVVPVEHLFPSDRVILYDKDTNEEKMQLELQMREEIREMAAIRNVMHKTQVAKHFNKKIKIRGFTKGELVLRKTEGGKLDPHWEGPYIIEKEVAPGAYKLKDCTGKHIANSWNVMRLRKYYP